MTTDITGIVEEALEAAALAHSLWARFNAGEMTEQEALNAWKANAVKVREEGDRFDRLMGRAHQ